MQPGGELAVANGTRHDHWYHLTPVSAIDAEVTIQCDDHALNIEFSHPNKARVRQRHWHVPELPHQAPERIDLRQHAEIDFQNVVGKQRKHGVLAVSALSEQKTGFGDHGRSNFPEPKV